MADLRAKIASLPLPIAQLVKRTLDARSSLARHNNAFYVAECTLKLAASARIGLWLERGLRTESDLARRLQALVLPSTGHWVEYFRETSRALAALPEAGELPLARTAHLVARRQPSWDAIRRLAESAREAGIVSDATASAAPRRGILGMFELAVAYRNEVLGHGAQRAESFYEQFAKLLFDAMGEVLSSSVLFDDLTLATPRLELPDDGAQRLVWVHLVGPVGIATDVDATGAVPGQLYFVGPSVRVPLHPLAVYSADEEEGRERVAFLNRTVRAGSNETIRSAQYLDYSSGENIRGVDSKPALTALLAKLSGRSVVANEVEQLADATMSGSLEARTDDPLDRESPVAPGETFAGKYEIESVIGTGAMGVVVAARHRDLGPVAIKFLRKKASADETSIARFLGEAKAASRISSEHAVRVTDVAGPNDATPYIVMEYLEGADLARVLRARGRLAPKEAASYLLQICEALAEAHAAGIVHRDLKPSNLFVARRKDGTPLLKVLDFGISKLGDADPTEAGLTKTSAVVGTPHYMAPEQMKASKDVTPSADIWSLGVVLYEALSGTLPFEAESYAELCAQVLSSPAAPSIASAAPDLPPGLASAVDRCLHRDPAKRHPSVAALARALAPFGDTAGRLSAERASRVLGESFDDEDASPEPKESRPQEATPQPRRNVVPIALATVVGLATAGGIVAIAARRSAEAPPASSANVTASVSTSTSASLSASASAAPVQSTAAAITASTQATQSAAHATKPVPMKVGPTGADAGATNVSTTATVTATATTTRDITQELMDENRPTPSKR